MFALRAAPIIVGACLTLVTAISAVRTVVVPRAVRVRLTQWVFRRSRSVFDLLAKRRDFAGRDRILALYAPFTLLLLPAIWLASVLAGYALVFAGLGAGWREAVDISGSSLLTLGFAKQHGLPSLLVSFSEAGLGLGLVALLITYLPSMYAAFSRRESMVALLEVRAGPPPGEPRTGPSAVEMLVRFHVLGALDDLEDLWPSWEAWFVDIEETHTSLGALAFFRSPLPHRSWVTSAGAVLDAASLMSSTVDVPRSPRAEFMIRAGTLSLRAVCDFLGIAYDRNPRSDDPISITRAEYDEALSKLADAGLALRPDREVAWRDFAGWRVNYDAVLLVLAALTMAPPAPWSSDRAGTRRELRRA